MHQPRFKNSTQTDSDEAHIALKFIGFLASDPDRLERFCALTGMGEQELKAGLDDSVMQGFLLDYALGDESLLLAFAAEHGLKPEDVIRARHRLPGFTG